MRPIASDFAPGGADLPVDWLRMSPYASSGTFTSRVFDAGSTRTGASSATRRVTPADTSLWLEVRNGDVATPDDSWSNWTSVANSGAIPGIDPFVQYRATFATTDPGRAPVLEEVTSPTPMVIRSRIALPRLRILATRRTRSVTS